MGYGTNKSMAKKDAAGKALKLVAPVIYKDVFGDSL